MYPKMKMFLSVISLLIVISATWILVSANFYGAEEDLTKINIFPTSNGDGYTAFDLRWHDTGIISYDRQRTDGSVDHFVRLHWNGYPTFSTFKGNENGTRMTLDISEELKDMGYGEYVFVVFVVYPNTPGVLGVESKSEPFIYDESKETHIEEQKRKNDPTNKISLTVEIRSERQAIITFTDESLQDLYHLMDSNPDFNAIWSVSFGTNNEYIVSATTSRSSIDGIFIENIISSDFYKGDHNNRVHIHHQTPTVRALRPHSPYFTGSMELQRYDVAKSFDSKTIGNSIIWEVSIPPDERVDFTKITDYNVEYIQMVNGVSYSEDKTQKSFKAADVVDMRNFGQVYDIGVPNTEDYSRNFREKVLGMTYEQADFLYFTPPESRYVLWRGELRTTINPYQLWYDGEDKLVDVFAEVYEIVCFDETGKVTNITTKVKHSVDEDDYVYSYIVEFRGTWSSKHKLVQIGDEYISYTRSGTTNNDYFSDVLGENGNRSLSDISNIDDYIKAMEERVLYYKLLEIIERRD